MMGQQQQQEGEEGEGEGPQVSYTLYCGNLPEKLHKNELKRQLHAAFSRYGRMLDIVACRGNRLRGQAWVVFDSMDSAALAKREMTDFPFHGKPMRIEYAKTKSDTIARLDGTYRRRTPNAAVGPVAPTLRPARNRFAAAADAEDDGRDDDDDEEEEESGGKLPEDADALVQNSMPNRVLLAQRLPEKFGESQLSALFAQHEGFQGVRQPTDANVALIEFSNETNATVALQTLHGIRIGTADETLHLTYAATPAS